MPAGIPADASSDCRQIPTEISFRTCYDATTLLTLICYNNRNIYLQAVASGRLKETHHDLLAQLSLDLCQQNCAIAVPCRGDPVPAGSSSQLATCYSDISVQLLPRAAPLLAPSLQSKFWLSATTHCILSKATHTYRRP